MPRQAAGLHLKGMDAWTLVLDFVLLLGAALLMGILFGRLRQNPIGGYLMTGILLGPSGLGIVRSGDAIEIIAELGVALLLFTIGLEFSWKRLRAFGKLAAWGGTLQIVLTLALFAVPGVLAGLPAEEAVIASAAVALSSTAVTLRVLTDRGELDSLHGRNALGILLLQDLAVVPLVLLVSALSGEGDHWSSLREFGLRVFQGLLLVVAMVIASRFVLPRLLHAASSFRIRDLPILLAVAVFLGAAWAAHALGLSPILGTFVAGMLLAETPFAEQIRADVVPLRAAFVTVFFASIGMLVKLPSAPMGAWALGFALLIVTGKAAVVALVVRLLGRPSTEAWRTGFALAQIGEFSFLLIGMASRVGLISEGVFQVLLSAALLTLFATPYLIAAAPRLAGILTRRSARRVPDELPTGTPARDRVIVVGFGPAGRSVVQALQEAAMPFIVLELNPNTVGAFRSELPIMLGDATQPEILEHVGLADAGAFVVTLPDSQAVRLIARQAKLLAPQVPVIARARHHIHVPDLLEAGANQVADEEEIIGHELARRLREVLGRQGSL